MSHIFSFIYVCTEHVFKIQNTHMLIFAREKKIVMTKTPFRVSVAHVGVYQTKNFLPGKLFACFRPKKRLGRILWCSENRVVSNQNNW